MPGKWHEDTKGYRVYPGVVHSEAEEAISLGCDGLMIIAPSFSTGAYTAAENIENDPNSPIKEVILSEQAM